MGTIPLGWNPFKAAWGAVKKVAGMVWDGVKWVAGEAKDSVTDQINQGIPVNPSTPPITYPSIPPGSSSLPPINDTPVQLPGLTVTAQSMLPLALGGLVIWSMLSPKRRR